MPLLPYDRAQLVQTDGLPRVVTADDETQHVLSLDGDTLRSVLVSEWSGPLPTEPTPAQRAAAIQAREVARVKAEQDAVALRQRVITTAGSAVGQSIDTLTAAQVRALLVCLLWKNGALTASGTVRPLAQWLG